MAIGVDDLRASARSLLKGVEAEVTLVVDVMLPSARLVDAVQAFEATFPTVTLRLHVEALSAVPQLVRQGGGHDRGRGRDARYRAGPGVDPCRRG
ncbi:MAG: hypothetical protein WDN69_22110 [Aliidongia sp.]